jgi:hypothetical protein
MRKYFRANLPSNGTSRSREGIIEFAEIKFPVIGLKFPVPPNNFPVILHRELLD